MASWGGRPLDGGPRGGRERIAPGARWWDRLPATVVDGVVALATAAVAMTLLAIGDEPDRHVPDGVGYALLVLACAPLVAGRRWPGVAVSVTGVTAVAYLALAYPGGPVTVPVLVALYNAAAWGRRMPALVVLAFFVGVGSAHRLVVQREQFVTVAFQGPLQLL